MKEKIEDVQKRKPYGKPEIEEIRLVVEESSMMTCKTGGQPSPNTNNCSPGQGCRYQNPS